eukprot:1798464-Amphidinium_carterae.1
MGCSSGVEGGRVCASHVAVLDAGEGLAMIISDPSDRLVGTILRPTRLYGRASSAKRPRPSKANRTENDTTEHARRWEQIAMYKAIWLAAGMQYELRNEETGVEINPFERGMVEMMIKSINNPAQAIDGYPVRSCWNQPRLIWTRSVRRLRILEIRVDRCKGDGSSVILRI